MESFLSTVPWIFIVGLLASLGSGRTGWISARGGNRWVGFVSRSVGSWVYWDVTVGYQKRRFTPHWTVNRCWRASKFKLVQDILIFTCLIPCAGGRGSILYPMLPRGKRRMMLKKQHATRVLDCYQCWNHGMMNLKGLIWCQDAFLFSYWKTCSWDFWTYFLYQFCYLSD